VLQGAWRIAAARWFSRAPLISSFFSPIRRHLKVLHLLAPGEVGGLERVVEMLARGQAAAGSEITVAAILDAPRTGHPLLDALGASGIDARACPVPLRGYLRERRAIAALIAEVRPDVVHTHGYRVDVVDAGVARRMGVPTVTTVHGFTGGGGKNRVYEWLQCRAYRRFDAVVAVSRPLSKELQRRGVHPSLVRVLPNAWNTSALPRLRDEARTELHIPRDRWVIGWVGRLSGEKGPDVLLESMPLLGDLPVEVSFIGEGRQLDELRATAAARGVESRVRWHGSVLEAHRLFPAFDVFVLSSRTEGTPIALFEAMAAGVPVIATRVGGVPDVVSEAEAVLVPPEDPAALAHAIRAVRTDPAAAARRAGRAEDRLRTEFNLEPWIEAYEMIYRDVAKTSLTTTSG
jgi:glycosyltransferase involved in cell wall biosynthesis